MPPATQTPETLEMVVYEIRELKSDIRDTRADIREDVNKLREDLGEIRNKVSEQIQNQENNLTKAWGVINAKVEQCDIRNEKVEELEKACGDCRPKVEMITALNRKVTTLIFAVLGGLIMAGMPFVLKTCGSIPLK